MADEKEKKKKKKKKETEEAPAPEPAPAPAPEPAKPAAKPASSKRSSSKRSSKKKGSSVFSCFSQQQVNEFKEGFQLMDADKDGILSHSDIRSSFDIIGRIASEKEIEEMLADAPGPINFTMLLSMFASRQSGEADDDDVIVKAFQAFDEGDGTINSDTFRHSLMTWGEKFTAKEVDEAFEQFDIDDDGKIDLAGALELLVGGKKEEEGEAAA
ncbi:Myosin regulatory light chain 2 [Amphibalanus amphitrite]|uniref:Myosin regulatory light chain 2 n=1 Tax=Amphibalanus amphitrite TaxID=1232801 RepID=A0A6A4WB21_AMPAM|nr:myosin regulatory light chain 2-like [Amphibalanus amphitrite]KAF0301004.1 Myosin regulatory light chain 2 [Amphibalanus amphitrite]KAF0309869.1 Myosin regulatory light chain 2 [Amphibalanus amphitrite]